MELAAAANADCPACRSDVWRGRSYLAEHHAQSTCRARDDRSYFRSGAAGSAVADLDCGPARATWSYFAAYCFPGWACCRGNSLRAQLATPECIDPAHLNRCARERSTALRYLYAPIAAAGCGRQHPAL